MLQRLPLREKRLREKIVQTTAAAVTTDVTETEEAEEISTVTQEEKEVISNAASKES